MRVKFILPSLAEAKSPLWRPIKYSLFPPLGLATLAAYLSPHDDAEIVDQHVQTLRLDDRPDLVVIQVYVTNAYRAYAIADHYRSKGCHVAMGGLHVTALPEEAQAHADTLFTGPAEDAFPVFLSDFRRGAALRRYASTQRTLHGTPAIRRDLIDRKRYLVPNSLVVSRGCPHHCSFCYKDAFFAGGRSFYTQRVDEALQQIDSLPGRHLYFLDDHLLASPKFARELFAGMRGMGRVFQAASTVDAILTGDLIEHAVDAGLRSLFVGFETLSASGLHHGNKKQNLARRYDHATRRLHQLGVKINGSFVFGFDGDDPDVFERTVEWGVDNALTTATFHILTPYPGTALHADMERQQRIRSNDWSQYDTRQVVYEPKGMTAQQLQSGYDWAYRSFYSWAHIVKAARQQPTVEQQLKQLAYTAAWKKLEPVWKLLINTRALNAVLPLLEGVLDFSARSSAEKSSTPAQATPRADTKVVPIVPAAPAYRLAQTD